MAHSLPNITEKNYTGSWILIVSDGQGFVDVVHVLHGEGANSLSLKAKSIILKIVARKSEKINLRANKFVDYMNRDETVLLIANRLAGLNNRTWFIFRRGSVHELSTKK